MSRWRGRTLTAYLPLALWITEPVSAKRVSVDQISIDDCQRLRVRSLTKLHLGFLDQCRAAGLTSADYPFNADHMGIRYCLKVAQARVGSTVRVLPALVTRPRRSGDEFALTA